MTKMTYRISIAYPISLVIDHWKNSIAKNTKINIKNSIPIEHAAPLLETTTWVWNTIVYNNHGNGNLKRM